MILWLIFKNSTLHPWKSFENMLWKLEDLLTFSFYYLENICLEGLTEDMELVCSRTPAKAQDICLIVQHIFLQTEILDLRTLKTDDFIFQLSLRNIFSLVGTSFFTLLD